MIIKIDRNEKYAVEKSCAIHGLTCRLYTIEKNHLMFQAEILLDNGRELPPEFAYMFGKVVSSQIERDYAVEKVKRLL